MNDDVAVADDGQGSPFERIRKVNETGNEYWESRDLAELLEYAQYRNFESVIEKAKLACINSGRRVEDHFADVSKMVQIGSGAVHQDYATARKEFVCQLYKYIHKNSQSVTTLKERYGPLNRSRTTGYYPLH